jgi:probable phosphoglycerate mutase
MTTFHLIRHAEAAVVGRVLAGRTDVHLSERGVARARELAQVLRREPIDKLVASPRPRTRETAVPLSLATGLPIEIIAAFDEVDFGEWTGKTVDELEQDPRWVQMSMFRCGERIPNGERLLDVQARFVEAMLRLHESEPGQTVAIVSHRQPIQIAVAYFVGAPIELFDRFEIGHASVTTIGFAEAGPRLLGLNRLRLTNGDAA